MRTAGVDRALGFARGPITTKLKTAGQADQPGPSFAGPFLMSVDGPGASDRFGVFRMFDLSAFPGAHAVSPVTARLINLSADALARLGGTDDPIGAPTGFTDLSHLFAYTLNDEGIPEDLASLGADGVYIANAPFIGLEGIYPNEMDVRSLADEQVQATLRGTNNPQQATPIPAVATLANDADPNQSLVVAVAEELGVNRLVLADAQLAKVYSDQPLPETAPAVGRPTAISALHDWPTRLDPKSDATVSRDLTVVMCNGTSLCVIPVQPAADPQSSPTFDMAGGLLSPGLGSGIGKIALGKDSSPRGMAYDPQTQLLFVANGTAGLTIVDLSVPGGSRDDDGDKVDDRVLGTVDLGGAQAERVTVWRDPVGGLVAAVATGNGGVRLARVLLPQTLAESAGVAPVPTPTAAASGCCCVDDGNPCTTEQCLNGVCVHVDITSATCCHGRAYDSTTQCCESGGPIAKCISDPTNFSAQCINDLSRCPHRTPRPESNFNKTTDACSIPWWPAVVMNQSG